MNAIAQKYAQKLADTNTFQHSGTAGLGENLYASYGSAVSGKTAVDAWYSEIKSYNFNNPGFSSSTGLFVFINRFKRGIRLIQLIILQVISLKSFGLEASKWVLAWQNRLQDGLMWWPITRHLAITKESSLPT